MNEIEDQWDAIVQGLLEGDQEICTEFWKTYGERLGRVANRRLPESLRRRVEPEDIVQSACRSFFRRVKGRKIELAGQDMLWPLLCAITINKVRLQIRFHSRQRRDSRRDQPMHSQPDQQHGPEDFLANDDVSPEEAAIFTEQMQNVLSMLSDEECAVVEMKLQDLNNQEIADRLLCSERTVRRMISSIRRRLQGTLLDSHGDGPVASP